ncbi:cation-binding protein [Clostridium butyricum]|uniref:Cation-binding protein n=2 Tax=Clostridium butyricum TaxID=1492 RepID=A0A512TNE6_CLOBU|nr:hemerythrin domain-containing protein [Clostridium butyricum]NOW22719.1 hemerythrin-like domain-containing protein [Clostridium butyricum]GEQ21745.1 cation-binding protein [Clostridium butyricum]
MINIDNFMRQHKEIIEELDCISKILNKQDYPNYLDEFVSHINKLAGKLNVHLSTEDKFLYPNLINGEDRQLKSMANSYIDEMGNISNVFADYRNKFNTKSKINERLDTFISETKPILNEIRKRIQKEETELYRLIVEISTI